MAVEVPELQDKCDFYMQEVMKADNTPVVKTMPVDLETIKEHQDTEKCIEKMLNKDKRFHVKNFRKAGSLQTNEAEVTEL